MYVNVIKNKMRKINIFILSIFIFTFYFNFCSAEYHKTNEDGTEISTSTAQELELKFPEREEGKLANELSELDDENSSINIINYKKPYFWLLLFSLILILFILVRLFKKLSHMDREFKTYENKIKSVKKEEISNKDEIIYSTNDTNNIKPIAENEDKIIEIQITKDIDIKTDEEISQKIHINNESENENQEIKTKKQDKEEDDDYIFDN